MDALGESTVKMLALSWRDGVFLDDGLESKMTSSALRAYLLQEPSWQVRHGRNWQEGKKKGALASFIGIHQERCSS